MEIYVMKHKRKPKDIILGRDNKYKYDLVFFENGYVHLDCFTDKGSLKDRLLKKPLYKGKFFPKENLSLEQFIDNGYSIYY